MIIIKHLFKLLFPEKCVVCGGEGEIICLDCGKNIQINTKHECPNCRDKSSRGNFCSKKCSNGYYFDRLIFCSKYSEKNKLKTLLKLFKYENKKNLYIFFGEILRKSIKCYFGKNLQKESYLLIPVPMEKKKLKTRGYNQSELMTKYIAKSLKCVYKSPLISFNYVGQQAGRNAKDRFILRANTMSIKRGYEKHLFNKNIILIDDVATTCSTVNECSRVLRNLFVNKIFVFTIART